MIWYKRPIKVYHSAAAVTHHRTARLYGIRACIDEYTRGHKRSALSESRASLKERDMIEQAAAPPVVGATVSFGREICGDLAAGLRREWLVANGLGGYASGTLAGINTRRYHGLLVAALTPPVGRTVLVGGLV